MKVLLDTNVLVRLASTTHVSHQIAKQFISDSPVAGRYLYTLPQCYYELWVVATRPGSSNGGLGLLPAEALNEIRKFSRLFHPLDDTPEIFPRWLALVSRYGVRGKTAHDVRLVAGMMVHSITHVATYNPTDFKRFSEIDVIDMSAS